ncbi:phosphotransferase enzyme family protein [Sorangium sp. So ce1389]|uniref:phosphotransferase enzyme family protein n=1 Tax=Sorangium sp. So ce1389 TaxID=3133336 RepID=UPI003F63F1A0
MTAPVDPAVLARALALYGLDPATCQFIGGFESQVFEARRGDGAFVLKLGDPGHRSRDAVEAECEWLEYLIARGVRAAPAIRAADGSYAALLGEPGRTVCARAYAKAPGAPLSADDLTPGVATAWGRLLGRLHAATKTYVPPSARRRHAWHEDGDFAKARELLLADEREPIGGRIERLIAELRALPTDRDAFGLVHTDAHFGNVLKDGGALTLIDFDDCAYEWFASDLGIVLFYVAIDPVGPGRPPELLRMFRDRFLDGYTLENALSARWLSEIDRFMKLRELVLYTAIRRVGRREALDPWCCAYLERHRPRILDDRPVWPDAG